MNRGPDRPDVVYVLPDKLGGVFSVASSLLAHRVPDEFEYSVVLTRNSVDNDARPADPLLADRVARVEYSSPPENVYCYLRRLRNAVGRRDGVIVCNDWVELAMISAFPTHRMVVNITHADADYYYRLAQIHEPWIDWFVVLTERMRENLCAMLPHRRDSIITLPYGVVIPQEPRLPESGQPLRALYVGRIEHDKGVLDFPRIDGILSDMGCRVAWTIQGTGSVESELRNNWRSAHPITWLGAGSNADVLARYRDHDILVLPSRSEGLPVTLLEAGAAGVVPVASDLRSGIPEIIEHGVTGLRAPVGDVAAFANAIAMLDADRGMLETMSANVARHVSTRFSATDRARAYQQLFARSHARKKQPRAAASLFYGSRLDQRWLPNVVVKWIRRFAAMKKPERR